MTRPGIAGNQSIDSAIGRCFAQLPKQVVSKFKRQFQQQLHDDEQRLHTFRELLLGAYLASTGESVGYEEPQAGLTPDWTLFRDDREVKGLVELSNFHAPRIEETEMLEQLSQGRVFSGWASDPTRRLYQMIQRKVDRYVDLANRLNAALVVSVFSTFVSTLDSEDLRAVLTEVYEGGVFAYSDGLSGVLYFEESGGAYQFLYFQNARAKTPIHVPDGRFV